MDFEKWKMRQIHKDKVFITDGAINIQEWDNSNVKILFLLKEAYSGKNEAFDLVKLVNKWIVNDIPRKGNTLPNMARWALSVKLAIEKKVLTKLPTKVEEKNILKKIAIVNLKKSSGQSKSNQNNLSKYVTNDIDLILEQIRELKPTIVICGATFNLIKKHLGLNKLSDKVYKQVDSEIIFIDYCHPSARISTTLTYHAIHSLVNSAMIDQE